MPTASSTSAKAISIEPTPPDHAPPAPSTELAFARQAMRAEADAIRRAADKLDDAFSRAVDLLVSTTKASGSVIVAGMGKSGLIGQKIAATLSSLGVPAQSVHPAEAAHGDLGRIRRSDALLALSHSGETAEVVALAQTLAQDGVQIIAITRGAGASALERAATVNLRIGDVEEACPLSLAPTSSTTAALALGDALALAAARRINFTEADFARRHPGGLLGDMLRPVTEALRFVAGKNLPVVRADQTVGEALRQADQAGRRPGALVVVDDAGALAGLFTDGDLRRLILRDADALKKPMRAVMTRSPRTLPATATVRDAVALVRENRQDEIPIVDEQGAPVGVLDVQDLVALKVLRD